MPQSERMRVWKGELKKTSGGLTKKDLSKNKRGKIVSRKKAGQAGGGGNNLGNWLRRKGESYQGVPDRVEKVKSPKIMVHKPKPKPKPKLTLRLKPKGALKKPLPKPKGALKKKPPKPPRRKKSPTKAGQKAPEKKHKVSVSNIVVPETVPKGWPSWAKKQLPIVQKWIRKEKTAFTDWEDLKEDTEENFPNLWKK